MRIWTAIVLSALAILATTANTAVAAIEQNDIISLGNGPGGPGGIFTVTEPADGSTVPFSTFCVQLEEYVAYNTPYKVLSITDHTVAGNNPLGSQSAWLYTQFTDLNTSATGLSGFNFASPTDLQANALQLGIWEGMNYLDSYIQSKTGWASAYVSSLKTTYLNTWLGAYATSGWTGIGDIRIMNLVDPNNDLANKQDQLIRLPEEPETSQLAPEPTAVLVWAGLAATLAVVMTRREGPWKHTLAA